MEKEDDYTLSFCLSFNSYTNDRTAETAERVRLEFSDESNDEFEFPILDKDESSLLPMATVTTQLRDLFNHDEDQSYSSSSSSSSDEEELDVFSGETQEKSLKGGWRKSKSTGASSSSTTSWRISALLKRSYSEGKQSLKFLKSNSRNRDESTKKREKVCAHEKFYLRNKAKKNEDKRKSYLPYKQHVVGFFFTVKY